MLTGGIDLGIKTVKTVIMRDNEIIASNIAPSGGFKRSKSAEQVWDKSLQQAKVAASDLEQVIATGTGKVDVGFATNNVVEIVADVAAGLWLMNSTGGRLIVVS